jgi:Holliday junction resolvase RusA-like endonuclease
MSHIISFRVECAAEGKPRATPVRRGNRTIMFKTATPGGFEDELALVANVHRPAEPLSGPVEVSWMACFAWPKPWPVKRRMVGGPHITKPDRDNVDKAILDVLTQCGYWADDCQVCQGTTSKFTGPASFVAVVVREIDA